MHQWSNGLFNSAVASGSPKLRLPAARPIWLATSIALVGAVSLPAAARADFIPPAGVSDYRLIFVTADGIASTSSNIADYNAFATSEAALNASLPSTVWTAVASTDTTSAASNIACTPDCSNIPIFLVDGTEVATSSNALFNAATVSLLNGIGEDQFGNSVSGYVWTGSNSDGTPSITTIDQNTYDDTMGQDIVELGFAGNTDGSAIDGGSFPSDGYENPIYAISGVITADSPVPEPASLSLLAAGGLMTGFVRRMRRRRRPAGE